MMRGRFERMRLAVNLSNLIVSVMLIAGAVWAIARRAGFDKGSWPDMVYGPVIEAFLWYWSLGLAAKALAALAGLIALIVLLVVLLFSFRARVEDWAVMLLGLPFYLLIGVTAFLFLSLIGWVIVWLLS